MEKHLVTVEFRYNSAPDKFGCTQQSKEITIGVFDTFEEACEEGNKALLELEKRFKLNPNWNRKERFSKNGGAYGSRKNLISDTGYLTTPFSFFAKITDLNYDNVGETINGILKDVSGYWEYRKKEQEEGD